MGDDGHLERLRARVAIGLPDAPQADDAERLALELDAAEGFAIPASLSKRLMPRRDMPRERDHQAEGVLGGGNGVAAREYSSR